MPKVSIIIPVYNTEKYLKQCIESLTNQTLSEIEIIMVDDGSKEECALLCDELAEKDKRIKVLHKQNEGQGTARNHGLKVATGEYIGFVDSDDYVKPEMYEVMYKAAKNNDADLVLSGVCFVGGNTFAKSGEYEEKSYFDSEVIFTKNDIKQVLLGIVGALPYESDDSRYGVSVCKNIFKRSLLNDNKLEFVSERKIISEDTIFMIDYVKCSQKVVGIPGAFYFYRRNDESFSKAYRSDRLEKHLILFTEIEERIKDITTESEYKLYLNRIIQGYSRVLCSQEIMYAYEQKLKYSKLKERLKRICANKTIADTLKTYPWYKLPKKQAAFAFAMKYKLYFLEKIMVILRAR